MPRDAEKADILGEQVLKAPWLKGVGVESVYEQDGELRI